MRPAVIDSSKKNALKLVQGVLKNNDASLKALSERCVDKRSPSTFARFLSNSTWDPSELNNYRLRYFQSLKQLKAVKEGVISLDDYISEKSGKHIKSAGWVYSQAKHKTVLGQNVVALYYKDDKKEYGLNYSVYLNKRESQKENVTFKTRLTLASELLQEVHAAGIREQIISMDSWFVTKALVSDLIKLGYHWVGRIKSNRICHVNGTRVNVQEVAKAIPFHEWQETPVLYKTQKKRKSKKVQYVASRIVDLQSLGRIKMVFVKEKLEGDVALFLGSDRFNLSALELLMLYVKRWRIETYFRDCKQNIDLSGYMGRSFVGFERFLCLVFVAHSFIKYLSLIGFWGRNNLPRGETFGAELKNYHQLCFERFISIMYDVSREVTNKSIVMDFFRNNYYRGVPLIGVERGEHMFYDLKSCILTKAS